MLTLSMMQVFTFVFFLCATIYPILLPSFWLTIFVVIWEGLLGGGVYVNALYTMATDVSSARWRERETRV